MHRQGSSGEPPDGTPTRSQTIATGGSRRGAAPRNAPSDTERAVAPSRAAAAASLQEGRYELLEVLAAGSSSSVYRAHDRQLGRHVAIELSRAISTDVPLQAAARARLLHDAQMLARLSHPNLVAAYDVGTHAGALFVAMEFIDGTSLRDWLAQPRRLKQVLGVLIAAGRGLAAAHASGVLHRDFGPANVVLSTDGRVRVKGFGLSRTPRAARARPAGTRGFIPPEQWSDGALDARGDQFSYAVTAFVALTGQEPYPAGVDAAELPSSLARARLRWPRSVPRALRRIVERGLSLAPERRYPTLAAMVNALEGFASLSERHSSRLAAAGAFAASVALSGALPKASDGTALCNVEAELSGFWDAPQRERVERAFLATGKYNAAEAFAVVSERLDRFRREWLDLRRDSCEATLVRGEQQEQVMLLRATCLDRALEGTKALVEVLGKVDAASMNRAVEASPASLSACVDGASLLGSAEQLPRDPSLLARIEEVEVGLAVNQSLVGASRGSEAVAHAEHILELARSTQHLPAIAKATAQLGRALLGTATTKEQRQAGEAALNESLGLAATAGDEQLLARTASYLVFTVLYAQTRITEGEAMLPTAEAFVLRAGNPPLSRIELSLGQSALFLRHNKFEAAVAVLEEAIRIAENQDGVEFQRFANTVATELGHMYAYLERFAESEAVAKRGVDGMRRLFGSHHPRMLSPLSNLSTLQAKAGHLEAALETIAEYRALAASLPRDEPRALYTQLTESRVWRLTGHCDRAIPLQREAWARFSAAHGPDHPLTTNVMGELGHCLAETHDLKQAIPLLERVLVNRRNTHDAAISDAAFALAKALGQVAAERSRARSLAEEARSLWQADDSSAQVREADAWLAAHPL